jgi:hypothetical protein
MNNEDQPGTSKADAMISGSNNSPSKNKGRDGSKERAMMSNNE